MRKEKRQTLRGRNVIITHHLSRKRQISILELKCRQFDNVSAISAEVSASSGRNSYCSAGFGDTTFRSRVNITKIGRNLRIFTSLSTWTEVYKAVSKYNYIIVDWLNLSHSPILPLPYLWFRSETSYTVSVFSDPDCVYRLKLCYVCQIKASWTRLRTTMSNNKERSLPALLQRSLLTTVHFVISIIC